MPSIGSITDINTIWITETVNPLENYKDAAQLSKAIESNSTEAVDAILDNYWWPEIQPYMERASDFIVFQRYFPQRNAFDVDAFTWNSRDVRFQKSDKYMTELIFQRALYGFDVSMSGSSSFTHDGVFMPPQPTPTPENNPLWQHALASYLDALIQSRDPFEFISLLCYAPRFGLPTQEKTDPHVALVRRRDARRKYYRYLHYKGDQIGNSVIRYALLNTRKCYSDYFDTLPIPDKNNPERMLTLKDIFLSKVSRYYTDLGYQLLNAAKLRDYNKATQYLRQVLDVDIPKLKSFVNTQSQIITAKMASRSGITVHTKVFGQDSFGEEVYKMTLRFSDSVKNQLKKTIDEAALIFKANVNKLSSVIAAMEAGTFNPDYSTITYLDDLFFIYDKEKSKPETPAFTNVAFNPTESTIPITIFDTRVTTPDFERAADIEDRFKTPLFTIGDTPPSQQKKEENNLPLLIALGAGAAYVASELL